jgi:hypothetical protein
MLYLAVAALLFLADDPAVSAKPNDAREPSATDRQFAEKWLAARRQMLDYYPHVIERTLKLNDVPSVREALQRYKQALAAAKIGDVPMPQLDFPLAVGNIGALRENSFRVLQRLSGTEARVEIQRLRTIEEFKDGQPYKQTMDVFLTRFDFSNAADDQEVKSTGCFVVKGTRTYETAIGGSRTVFVLEPFDSSVAESIYRKAVREERGGAHRANERRSLAKKEQETTAKAERKRRADADRYPALLKNARSLISAKLYAPAEKMLRRIIDEAPGTDAAKEAQKELDALPAH